MQLSHFIYLTLLISLLGILPMQSVAQQVEVAIPVTGGSPLDAPQNATQILVDNEQFTLNSIDIKGNLRIERDTILSYLGLRVGLPYNRYDINRGVKALFATGYFADITAYPQPQPTGGTVLLLEVMENPLINKVVFEGNRRLSDEDLGKEIPLKPRSVFTRAQAENSARRLTQVYQRSGRYAAQVEPKIITLNNNRINLVFEVEEGKETLIQSIDFIGNSVFQDTTLSEVIQTAQTRWWNPFSGSEKYDPDRVAYDRELLRRFYVSQGYADFKVKSSVAEISKDGGGFYLTFTVQEGDKYRFGDVKVTSNLAGADADNLDDQLITAKGDLYNADAIETSIGNITEKLGDRGFAFVEVRPAFERDVKNKTIDLDYRISEGPRVYVERININGNSRTLDEVIRREFRVAEGDAYSTSKLSRSEQRIKNLGFFEKVEVSQKPGSAPDQTVIDVEVAEQSTGEISIGAGFSSVDGALAEFGIRESNLLGRGQELRLNALLAAERQQFDLGFTEPYFLDRDLSAGFDLFKTRTDFTTESSFDRETLGGALRLGYALSEHLRHNLQYRLEEINITNVDANASRFIVDQEGVNMSSLVGHSLVYDTRNNRFETTEGSFFRFNQDMSGLGGDSRFLRHEANLATFFPLAKDWTLQLSGSGGHIFNWDGKRDVRINERFFIGQRQLRGFDRSGIGPRDVNTDDALGGNIYYAATAEVVFPLGLPEDLGFKGAIFTDVGSLWELDASGSDIIENRTPRASVGFGLLWRSPFGPIRLDFAKAVLKEDEDQTQIFNFNFGSRF